MTREGITADGVPASISEYMGKGESILVVDDVKEQRNLAAGMLSSAQAKTKYVKEEDIKNNHGGIQQSAGCQM